MLLRPLSYALIPACLLLAACGDGADDSANTAMLRLDVVGDLDAPSGTAALDGPLAMLTEATQRGLVRRDAQGNVIPDLATSWRVSTDGRNYIFRLRPAKWQDDREIKAGDVVAVMRRIMAPGSRHPLKPYLLAIENAEDISRNRKPARMLGVHDPRPDTVEIRLTSPMPELLQLLALPALSIQRAETPPPAAGSYVVADPDARPLLLNRNSADVSDDDGGGFDRIELQPQRLSETAIRRFQAGQTDMVVGASLEGLSDARTQRRKDVLRLEPSIALYGYVARSIDGPLRDPALRRALAMSIDRDALVSRLFAIPAMLPVTGILPAAVPASELASPDWGAWTIEERQTEAARLFADAGYGPDQPLDLTIALPTGRLNRDVLNAVAKGWALLGVRLKVVTRQPEAHARAIARGDFDMALVERRAPVAFAPFFLNPFACQVAAGGYCNPAADKLVADGWRSPDVAARDLAWLRAARTYAEDAALISLFTPVRWTLARPDLAGWYPNPGHAHPLARLKFAPTGRRPVLP